MSTPIPPTIQTLISTFKARDFATLPSLFTPDATYWVQGHPPLVPYGGTLPARERFPTLVPVLGYFETYTFDVLDVVVDQRSGGKSVALRVRTIGTGGEEPDWESGGLAVQKRENGERKERRYENFVAMVFRLGEDGKVESLREYLDNFCPMALFRGEQVFSDGQRGEVGGVLRGGEGQTEVRTETVVRGYIETLRRGDYEGAQRWFHEGARYWVNGRKREIHDAGYLGIRERLAGIRARLGRMSEVKIDVHGLIVDAGKAVTETTISGVSVSSGARVEDTAVTFLKVDDGKISQVYEFGDHVSGRP